MYIYLYIINIYIDRKNVWQEYIDIYIFTFSILTNILVALHNLLQCCFTSHTVEGSVKQTKYL